jgi:ureidoacrylate peracid hydrolase
MMHNITVRQEIIDRVVARRGQFHWFNSLDPKTTALLVIDMQHAFCEPGGPAEVPVSRALVKPINELTANLRLLGVPVFWILHANIKNGEKTDWEVFFNHVVSDEVRTRTVDSLMADRQVVWSELRQGNNDITVLKNRYSALIGGSSNLERIMRSMGIDTVLIAGTKTNVCCESTARDAMMLDFKVVMIEDCCAALSDDEHRSALETIIQQFGDVMKADEVIKRLSADKTTEG